MRMDMLKVLETVRRLDLQYDAEYDNIQIQESRIKDLDRFKEAFGWKSYNPEYGCYCIQIADLDRVAAFLKG